LAGSFQELPSKTYQLRPNRDKRTPCKALGENPPPKYQDLEMGTEVPFSIGRRQFGEVGRAAQKQGRTLCVGLPSPVEELAVFLGAMESYWRV